MCTCVYSVPALYFIISNICYIPDVQLLYKRDPEPYFPGIVCRTMKENATIGIMATPCQVLVANYMATALTMCESTHTNKRMPTIDCLSFLPAGQS